MRSSKPQYPNVPSPLGSKAGSVYSRFIPREELSSFSVWQFGSFSDQADQQAKAQAAEAGEPAPAEAEPQPEVPARDIEAEIAEREQAARQSGYQDGYRDGLVALESFKQSFAQQTSAQVGALLQAYAEQMESMQQEMACAVASAAMALARQVLRSELATRPELVAGVAQEAVEALLRAAQHVTLRVHPDDAALVAQGAAELLSARGARLLPDASVTRGGCLVEADIGRIDASLEARWQRAAAMLGAQDATTTAAAVGTDAANSADIGEAPHDGHAVLAKTPPASEAAP